MPQINRILILWISVLPWLANTYAATDIFVIQHPRNYAEAAQRDGLNVTQALQRDISEAGHLYVIIARRNDCWVNQSTSAVQRTMIIRTASGVIADAVSFPTYEPAEKWVAGIKQQVLRESGGMDMPRVHYLAPSNAAVEHSESLSPTSDPDLPHGVVASQQTLASDDGDRHRLTNWPQVIARTVVIVGLFCLVLYVLIRVKKEKANKQLIHQAKLDNLRQRVAGKETEFNARFPELQGVLHLNMLIFGAMLVLSQMCFAQTSIKALDVSISFHPMHANVKNELAVSLINGKPFQLVIFGDSVRNLGTVRTLSTLDSIFTSLPNDKNTRLSDALSWLSAYTDSLRHKGRKASVTFYSDFWNDDNDNEALGEGLIGLSNTVGSQKADSLTSGKVAIRDGDASFKEGILIGGFGSSVVLGLIAAIVSKGKKRGARFLKNVIISAGDLRKEFSIDQLQNRKIKVGPDIDADVRTFGSDAMVIQANQSNGTLSFGIHSPEHSEETIMITLNKEHTNE